jgi:cyanophycin synthetase
LITAPEALPFEDSRRLTGANLYFDHVGAVLETLGVSVDDALLDGWQQRVKRMSAVLQWPEQPQVIRRHASGAALALRAPLDQLLTATEVNEWAWLATPIR